AGWMQYEHPRPRMKLAEFACCGVRPAARISCVGGLSDSLHFGQTRRTRRWAMMAMTLEATRKGGTPMSCNLVIALGASFVCSVLKTKCPVREACTAMSAVS